MNILKKKKDCAFLLLVAVGMLLSTRLPAQEQGRPGGLFGGTSSNISGGLFGRGRDTASGNFFGQSFGETNGNITGQTFGDNVPLGSGLFVLLATGIGYATMKSGKKQNKQNRKENQS